MAGSSLVERLGHGPEDRLLIVNCDDLGSSRAANLATARCMDHGVATSASLMVHCPAAFEAARMLQGYPVGMHLTLTSEYPTRRWRGLTNGGSLHDGDGFLPTTRAAALRRLDAADARAECRAQVEAALAWGVDPTHLDAHMDVLLARADLLEVYLDLAAEFRLPARMPSPDADGGLGTLARERTQARGVLFPDHLVYLWPRRTRDVLFGEIPGLPPGVSEVFAHPVLDGGELRAYDPAHADLRAQDAECLTDPAVSDLLDRQGVKRISHRALRGLQRLA